VLSIAAGILLGRRVGRGLRSSPIVGALLVASVGAIASATLTPLDGRLHLEDIGPRACDFSRMALAPLSELRGITDTSLNIALFVPLGLAVALLPRSGRSLAILLAAVALPFAIELTQLVLAPLGRGCQSADVIDNLTGLVVGMSVGLALRAVVVMLARRR